jgi:hypothetical protein
VESVLCAVLTEVLYETDAFRLKRVNIKCNERIVRNTEFEIIGQWQGLHFKIRCVKDLKQLRK